jgi:hypothetical protein
MAANEPWTASGWCVRCRENRVERIREISAGFPQVLNVREDGLEGRFILGAGLPLTHDATQPLHLTLILPCVPQHGFDLGHKIEALHLQDFGRVGADSLVLRHLFLIITALGGYLPRLNHFDVK